MTFVFIQQLHVFVRPGVRFAHEFFVPKFIERFLALWIEFHCLVFEIGMPFLVHAVEPITKRFVASCNLFLLVLRRKHPFGRGYIDCVVRTFDHDATVGFTEPLYI